jgi:hypothetical protein
MTKKLDGKRVAMRVTEGFEEVEPTEALRDVGAGGLYRVAAARPRPRRSRKWTRTLTPPGSHCIPCAQMECGEVTSRHAVETGRRLWRA